VSEESIQIGSPVDFATSARRQETAPIVVFELKTTYNLSLGAMRKLLIDAVPEVTASDVFPVASTV
jgi:hypothetical protein